MKERLGERFEPWFRDTLGVRIDPESLSSWNDFSDPMQVIFGYPESPGTYAFKFPTQVDSGLSDGIYIFFFIHVKNGILKDVSYTIVDIDFDGKGNLIDIPTLEPDKAVMENLLLSITHNDDQIKIQTAIEDRLRKMPLEELTMARDFFRQVYDDPGQYQKYDKIIQELSA